MFLLLKLRNIYLYYIPIAKFINKIHIVNSFKHLNVLDNIYMIY